jgi:hypothetical protein
MNGTTKVTGEGHPREKSKGYDKARSSLELMRPQDKPPSSIELTNVHI